MASDVEKLAKAEPNWKVDSWSDVDGSEVKHTYAHCLSECSLLLFQLDAEFIAGVAKRVSEAREQTFEGVAKGAKKVSKTYAS